MREGTGKWKAVQDRKKDTWALYDLSADISETTDLAADNGEVLEKLIAFAKASHVPVQENC